MAKKKKPAPPRKAPPKRDKHGRFIGKGKSKKKSTSKAPRRDSKGKFTTPRKKPSARGEFDPLGWLQRIVDGHPFPVDDYAYDTFGDGFNQVWDTYELSFDGDLDISQETIEACFEPFRKVLSKPYAQRKTILLLRVYLVSEAGKGKVIEQWIKVTATVSFVASFGQIEDSVETWMTHNNYLGFDAAMVKVERPDKWV